QQSRLQLGESFPENEGLSFSTREKNTNKLGQRSLQRSSFWRFPSIVPPFSRLEIEIEVWM
ncbi:MAG: hypothetical protein O2900_08710, partial [Proteobacteria bacterium]|nr:hypothetical protein [Pseudomonadota bacterium]